MAVAASPFRVVRGTSYALFAYDVAWSVDLDDVQRRMAALTERSSIKRKPRAPQYLDFRPPPLRIVQESPPVTVAGFVTRPSVDVLLYDFGALSVTYRIPIEEAPLDRLLDLSDGLYENEELLAESRRRVEGVVELLGTALERPRVSRSVEDYAIYEFEAWVPEGERIAWPGHDQDLARILRCERERLSAQEAADALSHSISFKPTDLALIDWNAAILFGPDSEDLRAVLEFANVALLESRTLDAHLDDALDRAHEAVAPSIWSRLRLPGRFNREASDIAQIQVDNAILFERVNNTLKLLGDEYLARAYRLATERFNLGSWEAAIRRKLQTLDAIYGKLSDRTSTLRLELLEWIIILLIAVSIVIPFLTGSGH